MQLRGLAGRLERGYAVAAELGAYTVTRTPEAAWCQLTAEVVRVVDLFQLAQPGLVFVAPTAKARWIWTVEAHAIDGRTVTARLSGRPRIE